MGLAEAKNSIQYERADKVRMPGEQPSLYQRHRRFAIPLASKAAFVFYLHYLVLPHSFIEILWATLARKWSQLGRALLFVFQQKSDHAPLHESITGIASGKLQYGQRLYHALHLHLRDAGFEPLGSLSLLTLDDHENSCRAQTVAFLFDQSTSTPLAVAKLSSDPRQYTALKGEFETIRRLSCIFDSRGFLQLPRPLRLIESSPWIVVLESWLPGRTAYFQMRNSWNALQEAPGHFRLALKSLIALQSSGKLRKIRMSHSAMLDFVVRPLQTLATHGCPSAAELRLIEKTIDLAQRFIGTELIMVAHHGDFWAGNLVIHNGSVGLIDWEYFEEETLPFDDLFFFSTTYGLNYPWKLAHWASPEAAFRATYLLATELAQLVRDYLLHYCRAMGIAADLLEVFFPVVLATRAQEGSSSGAEYEDAVRTTGPRGNAKCVTRSGCRKLWRDLFRIYAECSEPVCFSDRRQTHR